jgi:hypothetical protein
MGRGIEIFYFVDGSWPLVLITFCWGSGGGSVFRCGGGTGTGSMMVHLGRDGNGADRDRIMGDPNPPRPINM